MKKQFFAIIALALISQLYGMEKGLYPHDYDCKRSWYQEKHDFKKKFPVTISREYLECYFKEFGEYNAFDLNEQELRAFYQFVDGKAPIVTARRAFYDALGIELGILNQQLKQSLAQLRRKLGRPVRNGNVIPEKNNSHWQNLNAKLANPPAGEITWWKNVINEIPNFSQPLEKIALTSNLIGAKQSHYFKEELVHTIALCVDGVFRAQTAVHDEEIEEKNAEIARERAAKETACGQLAAAAAQQTELVNELRRLEPEKENLLRSMRQKLGQLLDATQIPPQTYQMEDATWAQNIANRLDNPPQDDIRNGIQLLQDTDSTKLCDFIIKTSQVDPQNAKAVILTVISHVRIATIQAYACPLLEKLNKAKAQLEEQRRKGQADLEAVSKSNADSEARLNTRIATLSTEKTELIRDYATAIATTQQQADQIGRRSARAFQEFEQEIAPLRQELPALRDQVKEQVRVIQELRNALAARNNQQ